MVSAPGDGAMLAGSLVVLSGSAKSVLDFDRVGARVLLVLLVVLSIGELRSLDPWESFVRFFFRNPSVGMNADTEVAGW